MDKTLVCMPFYHTIRLERSNMHTDMKKIIFSISVVILFFGLTLSPVISAKRDTFKEPQLNVLMHDITNNNHKFQIHITQEQLEEVKDSVDDFIMFVNAPMDENRSVGIEITVSKLMVIKTKIYGLIDLISGFLGDDFPVKDTKIFINSVFGAFFKNRYCLRQPILSIGMGITWIPFYNYETMIGRLFKPVFIHHILGFSATFKLLPFAHGFPSVKYGFHHIRTFFFTGLLIDFADLAFDRLIGPQILIGFGLFTGFA